jgi:hypothetical protein
MARSTVFRYKGREADAQEVGRALKVRAVLTGQLEQRGNRLILKIELVNVKDGSQLWGEHYLDDNLEIVAALGYSYGRSGQRLEAQQVLDQLQQLSRTRYVSPMLGALITLGMGEHDRALGWLEQAHAERAQMMSELKAEPAFDPLRADPRFVDLLGRVGLEAGEPTGRAFG